MSDRPKVVGVEESPRVRGQRSGGNDAQVWLGRRLQSLVHAEGVRIPQQVRVPSLVGHVKDLMELGRSHIGIYEDHTLPGLRQRDAKVGEGGRAALLAF